MYALADVENSGHTSIEHPQDPDGEDAVAAETHREVQLETSGVSARLVEIEN